MALAAAVRQLGLGRNLDEPVEPGGVLLQAPLGEGEGAGLDRLQAALGARQAAVRRQEPGHGVVWNLADVVEQVLADRDLGQLLEMERLPLAPQHLDGGFGKRHALP